MSNKVEEFKMPRWSVGVEIDIDMTMDMFVVNHQTDTLELDHFFLKMFVLR